MLRSAIRAGVFLGLALGLWACDDAGGSAGFDGGVSGPSYDGTAGTGGAGGSGGSGWAPGADAGLLVDASVVHGGAGGEGGAGGGSGAGAPDAGLPTGNTNIALGGSQDLGYFRRLLDANRVPTSEDFDAEGFFGEHHTPLPEPDCGERVCLQAMLGVMGNLMNGANCTLLQIGLNSPLVADPGARPPLSLTVVVDTSGSMADRDKMAFVQQGLEQMIDSLFDEDQIAIVTYSSEARLVQPMAQIRGRRNELSDVVARLSAAGATNLYAGLEQGYREAMRSYDSGRQNRVILLSDGQPTRGITDEQSIMDLSRRFNSEGVGLTTVGLGLDFNHGLMRGLAEQGDGNFYFVEDAAAVREVFAEELSYFTVPVAFDVHLEMREGSDYRFVRAYGSRMWEEHAEGIGGEIDVPSVFLAHRESHSDVGPGGTRRGGGSALLVELMPIDNAERAPGDARVATVDLAFREPGTDRIVQQALAVTYPDHPLALARSGFFENRIVEKSFVMLNIYVAMVLAVDQFHLERDAMGAIGMLERLIAAVEDYEDSANDGTGDVDMQLDVELLQQLIDVMLANGGRQPDNNDIPDDPWPAD
jgi:Ca-activated chloride channel family protein